ncbi:MAG: hypothetical protein ABXS93_08170 [Sulfurimonas sp.]
MLQYTNHFGDRDMSRKRKTYSAEFKTKVVLELLADEQTGIDPRVKPEDDSCKQARGWYFSMQ